MNDSIPEILTDRALRRVARTCVVLADRSKLGAVAPAYVFGIDEVDILVTDAEADSDELIALAARGVRVVLAASPERSTQTA